MGQLLASVGKIILLKGLLELVEIVVVVVVVIVAAVVVVVVVVDVAVDAGAVLAVVVILGLRRLLQAPLSNIRVSVWLCL